MSKVNDKNVGFAEGTTVLMANGGLKPIEKIQPGEWVMSFDASSSSSELEPREVIDTFKHIIRDVLEVQSGEDSMIVARGQLFLAPNADWHFAHEVANITDVDGNPRTFNVTKVIGGKHKIYDIIVDKNHSLVANGFRVHNGMSWGSTPVSNNTANGSIKSSNPGDTATGGVNRNAGGNQGTASVDRDRQGPGNVGTANSIDRDRQGPGNVGGQKVSEPKGSVGFADRNDPDSIGYNGGGGGGGGGGNGGRDTPGIPQRSGRRSKSVSPKAQSAPAPDKKVLAYTAYIAVQETMDYICDVQITYLGTSYFTVRTAVSNYMKYADALSKDALAHVLNSTMGQSDKNNLQAFHEDITNVFTIIRNSWATPDDTAVNLESIKRACLNVKQFIDRSTGVIGKYIGSQAPTLKYTVPGLPAPGVVQLPTGVQSPLYVKTTANTWITTAPSATGNTTTPPTTGGIGASYTKTRVVRGYLYSYAPGKGWSKIGPADQYRELS